MDRHILVFAFAFYCLALAVASEWTSYEIFGASAADPVSSNLVDDETDGSPSIWAVLVAGSNGWWNYRHQADICHAYHILRNHGVPASNIITMMYDDIAHNPENHYPGKIFNSPNGSDVYAGVKIDYRGDDVTSENFVAVLTGKKSATKGGSGRVLKSTKKDKVFVYFADHGSSGMIIFPTSIMTVKELERTMRSMHGNGLFKELTFYMEACYSGTMFNGVLPPFLNIYAVTAANTHESSFACYCDNSRNLPCLGDLFSVNWMEDSDRENLERETLKSQFDIVRRLTNLSHVQHFGDPNIWMEPVGDFQGEEPDLNTPMNAVRDSPHDYTMWPSQDVAILETMRSRDRETNPRQRARLNQTIHVMKKKRSFLETHMEKIVEKIVHDQSTRQRVLTVLPAQLSHYMDCHNDVVHAFNRICFNFSKNTYAAKYTYVLANLCELRLSSHIIIDALMEHCAELGDTSALRIV